MLHVLKALAVSIAKAKEKPYKMADGGGLYLLLFTTLYQQRFPSSKHYEQLVFYRFEPDGEIKWDFDGTVV